MGGGNRASQAQPAGRTADGAVRGKAASSALSRIVASAESLGPVGLYEAAIRRSEAQIAKGGALNIVTTPHTGRSPKDKFVVRTETTDPQVDWGDVNHPMAPETFARLRTRLVDWLESRPRYVDELAVRVDRSRLAPITIVSESPAHLLFAHHLFVRPEGRKTDDAPITIFHAPTFQADPVRDDVRSSTVIALDLEAREILICGTRYAGEIKKSVFSLLQYVLPQRGIATMHCSANRGEDGRVALFFGLSGTGKTTLSTDPTRTLVGDDEHGWSESGIFNFEGGLYAKAIALSAAKEPEIYAAVHSFGTVLENVVLDPRTRAPQLDGESITENTRAAFPVEMIPSADPEGAAGHPSAIVMLTADAFGVLPPVARLSVERAMEIFLLGYTSKLAGTERGVTSPEATFSACFSSPFLPLPPTRYAELLGERIRAHGPSLWLVNTGWTGGPYGVGHRMDVDATRAIVRAIVGGALDDVRTETEPHFGLEIPTAVVGVPGEVLRPWESWADADAYADSAADLARQFREQAATLAK